MNLVLTTFRRGPSIRKQTTADPRDARTLKEALDASLAGIGIGSIFHAHPHVLIYIQLVSPLESTHVLPEERISLAYQSWETVTAAFQERCCLNLKDPGVPMAATQTWPGLD